MNEYNRKNLKKDRVKAVYFDRVIAFNLVLQLIMLALFLSVATLTYAEQITPKVPRITVYKSPTCGCCTKWIKHLEKNGFHVEAKNSKKMREIKRKLGIEPKFQSCHTGLVNGYYIEGHVPAKDIKRLLKEKPKAVGLTVPGMPMGSPGMEGARKDPYSVLLIKKDKSVEEFSKN